MRTRRDQAPEGRLPASWPQGRSRCGKRADRVSRGPARESQSQSVTVGVSWFTEGKRFARALGVRALKARARCRNVGASRRRRAKPMCRHFGSALVILRAWFSEVPQTGAPFTSLSPNVGTSDLPTFGQSSTRHRVLAPVVDRAGRFPARMSAAPSVRRGIRRRGRSLHVGLTSWASDHATPNLDRRRARPVDIRAARSNKSAQVLGTSSRTSEMSAARRADIR